MVIAIMAEEEEEEGLEPELIRKARAEGEEGDEAESGSTEEA